MELKYKMAIFISDVVNNIDILKLKSIYLRNYLNKYQKNKIKNYPI